MECSKTRTPLSQPSSSLIHMSPRFRYVCLHDLPKSEPQYQFSLHQAVHLLNSEWPRSEAARVHSLTRAEAGRAFHVLLLLCKQQHEGSDRETEVVGHAAAIRERNPVRESCDKKVVYTIQSVVIRSDMRNQGLGKDLMQQVEKTVIAAHPNEPAITFVLEADKNSRLPNFYSSLGYTLIDNRPPACLPSPTSIQHTAGEDPSLRPPPPPPPPPLLAPLTSGTSEKVILHKIVTCECDES